MKEINMICIRCPKGCEIRAEVGDDNSINSITGNSCSLGKQYAESEITDPRRMVCSTVKLIGSSEYPLVACKTKDSIPKALINAVMKEINSTEIKIPVKIGDVLIENVANTGVDVVATQNR